MITRTTGLLLSVLVVALALAGLGCPPPGGTSTNVTENGNENTNKSPEQELTSSGFKWGWCPYECDGVCQEDPCGPPAPTPPDPPTDCNEANIKAWIGVDPTFRRLMDAGDLRAEFDASSNTLKLTGRIEGDSMSIRRFHARLSPFLGRNPANMTGVPCILTIEYLGS